MSEPATEFIIRKELFEALAERGFSEWDCRELIQAGVIEAKRFSPKGRKKFNWPQVKEALGLNGK